MLGTLKKAGVGAIGVLLGEAVGRFTASKQPSATAVPIIVVTGLGYMARKRGGMVGGLGTGFMVNGMIPAATALASRFGIPVDPALRNF